MSLLTDSDLDGAGKAFRGLLSYMLFFGSSHESSCER